MTEQQWQSCTDPTRMLEFLKGNASDRELWLFAVACCRRLFHMLPDERSRKAIEVASRCADNLASERERMEAQEAAQSVWDNDKEGFSPEDTAAWAADTLVRGEHLGDERDFQTARWASEVAKGATDAVGVGEQAAQATLLRDIFGNPFRPVVAASAWLTSTVLALATGIYEDGAFDRLPILADALQDAGCDDPDILDHCRSEGPHVRGCWVVDLLLGKS